MNDSLATGTIVFDDVSKRFRLGMLGTISSTLSALRPNARNDDTGSQVFWALRNVSFKVEPGTALGLIGPNGAGKTTTLKLLSNITRPTSGRIQVHGRISSLIELGAGFHPELTGRENVYLNGAILGLTRREIAQKFDSIVAFAGLERFIDTPVKRYSSGMYVRLGFAVAAHVEPDILLVDEVLAVGDASFRHRCIQRMEELRSNGTTVIFVSHNMHLVRSMCNSALLLAGGQIRTIGPVADVIREYERALIAEPARSESDIHQQANFHSTESIVLTAVDVTATAEASSPNQDLTTDKSAVVKIAYRTAGRQPIGRIDIRMIRDDSTLCTAIDVTKARATAGRLDELTGTGEICVTYDPLQLTAGRYTVIVRITDPTDSLVVASGQSQPFDVFEDNVVPEPGIYIPTVSWAIHRQPEHAVDSASSQAK